MGKNFSCNNLGQRNKSDFYQTHYSMTEQLLENEKFDYDKEVLEPACGKGAIHKVLLKYFKPFNIGFYDIELNEINFLNTNEKFKYIICNPPFSLAFEFIEKSKEIATEKFAMLLPLSYLHGQKRYESKIFRYENYPLTKVYVFTRYPLLTDTIREDGKYNTGMMVYCWMIWEKQDYIINGDSVRALGLQSKEYKINLNYIPIIRWIDNNKYILNKKDKDRDNEIKVK